MVKKSKQDKPSAQTPDKPPVLKRSSKPTKTKIKEADTNVVTTVAEYLGSAKNKKIIKTWQKNNGGDQVRWWLSNPEQLYSAIEGVISRIETAQTTRRLMNIRSARLYGNYEAIDFAYSRTTGAGADGSSNRITMNVIQSVIDACAAKIAKDKPKVSFLTTGAEDYFLRARAANLTKFIGGMFKSAGVYDNSELVFRDACVVGTGYLKIFEEDDKIKTEWVAMDEIRVDDLDGLKQKPRSMHQVRLVPRDTLMYQFPEEAQKINSAQAVLLGKVALQSTVDMIRVIESWHLKSGPDAVDGLHTIVIENCTLFQEEYIKDYFPIVPFRWYNRPLGFFGRSITEEILTIQVEINKILRTIQQSQELAAVPIVFIPNDSEVSEDVIGSNVIARMVPYSGPTPPSFVTPTAQNPEVYQHLNSLIQWAYQIVGLNQQSASGMKQPGVDSAVAIREVADIETGRFALVASRWENWFVEVARIMVDLCKDLYTRKEGLASTVIEKKIIREIKWKDVDLTEHPYEIQTFPTSQLPDTPAGRIQTISEYIQNQWISKEKGMELLNLDPDLEQEIDIQTSSLRLTEKWLSEMVEDGTVHKPEPFMNLQLAQQVATGVYNQLMVDGCPEDRLELVRQFILDIVDMLNPPPPPAPPMPEGQMGPQGPMPPQAVMPQDMQNLSPEQIAALPGIQPAQAQVAPLAPTGTPLSQTQQ